MIPKELSLRSIENIYKQLFSYVLKTPIFEKSTEDYLRRVGRAFNYNKYFFQEYVSNHDEIYESSECFTDLSNKAILTNR